MSNVDSLENGFFFSHIGFLLALAKSNLTGSDRSIVDVIKFKTSEIHSAHSRRVLQFGRTFAPIPIEEFREILGFDRKRVLRTIKNLETKNIIQVIRSKNEHSGANEPNLYSLNTHTIWKL